MTAGEVDGRRTRPPPLINPPIRPWTAPTSPCYLVTLFCNSLSSSFPVSPVIFFLCQRGFVRPPFLLPPAISTSRSAAGLIWICFPKLRSFNETPKCSPDLADHALSGDPPSSRGPAVRPLSPVGRTALKNH